MRFKWKKIIMKTALRLLLVLTLVCIWIKSASASAYILDKDSSKTDVEKVQTIFNKIWVYSGEIDWDYESIKATIIELQKKLAVIKSEDDEKAWNVDATLLKRAISTYKETPQRKETLAKTKAISTKTATVDTTPDPGLRKFIVTAYYSPLRGQKKYSTGSYWWDIRLNGEWTHWASWAWVYYGFIAAPQNYPFWTKIWLEGFWNGVVEDRWGAIVNAGRRWYEYDRLDIWMGYGDAWLQRALQWWKRTVNGKILSDDAQIIDNFSDSAASKYYGLRVNPESWEKEVRQLQELLQELWVYQKAIDGKYETVEDSLIAYQIESNIILNKDSDWAGYFWPRTFNAVQRDFAAELNKQEPAQKNQVVEVDAFPNISREEKEKLKTRSKEIQEFIQSKSAGNRIIRDSYEREIKQKLNAAIEKATSEAEKDKIRYLVSLL